MAKDSGASAANVAAAAASKKATKEERRTTKEDKSRSRMKKYAMIALGLGWSVQHTAAAASMAAGDSAV